MLNHVVPKGVMLALVRAAPGELSSRVLERALRQSDEQTQLLLAEPAAVEGRRTELQEQMQRLDAAREALRGAGSV